MLFVGDDWAGDHHDVEILNEDGRRLAQRRLPGGLDGVSRLHALIAAAMPTQWAQLGPPEAASRVKIAIETERGPWVASLVAAGHEVFAINPLSTARYRERRGLASTPLLCRCLHTPPSARLCRKSCIRRCGMLAV